MLQSSFFRKRYKVVNNPQSPLVPRTNLILVLYKNCVIYHFTKQLHCCPYRLLLHFASTLVQKALFFRSSGDNTLVESIERLLKQARVEF